MDKESPYWIDGSLSRKRPGSGEWPDPWKKTEDRRHQGAEG